MTDPDDGGPEGSSPDDPEAADSAPGGADGEDPEESKVTAETVDSDSGSGGGDDPAEGESGDGAGGSPDEAADVPPENDDGEPPGDEGEHPDGEKNERPDEEDLPDGVGSIALREAGAVSRSVVLWVATVAWTLIAAATAALVAPTYTGAIEGALAGMEDAPDEEFDPDRVETLELLLGSDVSPESIRTALESLVSTGDLFATLLFTGFLVALGPVVGLLVVVPAVLRRRDHGEFRGMVDAGVAGWEVAIGTFLGRSVGVVYPLVGIGLGIAAGTWIGVAPVGSAFLTVVVLSILYVAVFVAFGTAVGSVSPSKLVAGVGAFGVWAVFYLLGVGTALQATSLSDGGEAIDLIFSPFGGFLPPILQRFHPYNLLVDNSLFVGLSGTLETFPRIAYAAIPRVLDHDLPPQEAVGELPFYLQHWFGYLVLLVWIAVPLAVAAVGLRPDLE